MKIGPCPQCPKIGRQSAVGRDEPRPALSGRNKILEANSRNRASPPNGPSPQQQSEPSCRSANMRERRLQDVLTFREPTQEWKLPVSQETRNLAAQKS